LRFSEKEKTPLPYSIERVLKKQESLVQDSFLRHQVGTRLSDQDMDCLVPYLIQKFADSKRATEDFFRIFLSPFRSKVIEEEPWFHGLRRMASLLAMESPEPQPVWTFLSEETWTPVCVSSAVPRFRQGIVVSWMLSCLALCGPMTETQFDYPCSERMVRRLAYLSGFNPRSKIYCYYDGRQLVQLRLLLLIAKGSTSSRVRVADVGRNSSIISYNQKVTKFRDLSKRRCPRHLTVPCFRCNFGLDVCPLAVIPETIMKEEK
jgi:hypothetical protein